MVLPLWGLPGALLAVPMTASQVLVLSEFQTTRPSALLAQAGRVIPADWHRNLQRLPPAGAAGELVRAVGQVISSDSQLLWMTQVVNHAAGWPAVLEELPIFPAVRRKTAFRPLSAFKRVAAND